MTKEEFSNADETPLPFKQRRQRRRCQCRFSRILDIFLLLPPSLHPLYVRFIESKLIALGRACGSCLVEALHYPAIRNRLHATLLCPRLADELLRFAAAAGHVHVARMLLLFSSKPGVSVALQAATQSGCIPVVSLCIVHCRTHHDHGLRCVSGRVDYAFRMAARLGDASMMTTLLQSGGVASIAVADYYAIRLSLQCHRTSVQRVLLPRLHPHQVVSALLIALKRRESRAAKILEWRRQQLMQSGRGNVGERVNALPVPVEVELYTAIRTELDVEHTNALRRCERIWRLRSQLTLPDDILLMVLIFLFQDRLQGRNEAMQCRLLQHHLLTFEML